MATKLLYLESPALRDEAIVQEISPAEGQIVNIILDQTIFHCQGGGQQSDRGILLFKSQTSEKDVIFTVNKVSLEKDSGHVLHQGIFPDNILQNEREAIVIGTKCQMIVDKEERLRNSTLHTAGHVIDFLMILANTADNCFIDSPTMKPDGSGIDLRPIRGYHFPDSPYLEYAGLIPANKRAQFVQVMQKLADETTSKSIPVEITMRPFREIPAEKKALLKGDHSDDEIVRVVGVGGYICGCGGLISAILLIDTPIFYYHSPGTHLRDVNMIKKLTIRKVICKGGTTRVCYSAEPVELGDIPEDQICAGLSR